VARLDQKSDRTIPNVDRRLAQESHIVKDTLEWRATMEGADS